MGFPPQGKDLVKIAAGTESIGTVGLDAGTNRVGTVSGVLKEVSAEKSIVAAGNYAAEDVISESVDPGTVWTFAAVARANGAYGKLVYARLEWQTTGLTALLTLYLYKATPTCNLKDNVAHDGPVWADRANYVGQVDFDALEDMGGVSYAIATPNTPSNLPLAFKCAAAADDLLGVLVTRTGITTEVAGEDIRITLGIEQY